MSAVVLLKKLQQRAVCRIEMKIITGLILFVGPKKSVLLQTTLLEYSLGR